MAKYKTACSSLRRGQLDRLCDKIKDVPVVHGSTCYKVDHIGTGYLHAEDDDTPYDVDGCLYCGRCHYALDKVTIDKTKEKFAHEIRSSEGLVGNG